MSAHAGWTRHSENSANSTARPVTDLPRSRSRNGSARSASPWRVLVVQPPLGQNHRLLSTTSGDWTIGLKAIRHGGPLSRGQTRGQSSADCRGRAIGVLWPMSMRPCIRVGAIYSDRRLPVLNRDKRPVGIISLGDVAVIQDGHYAETALRGISEPGGPHSQPGGPRP